MGECDDVVYEVAQRKSDALGVWVFGDWIFGVGCELSRTVRFRVRLLWPLLRAAWPVISGDLVKVDIALAAGFPLGGDEEGVLFEAGEGCGVVDVCGAADGEEAGADFGKSGF